MKRLIKLVHLLSLFVLITLYVNSVDIRTASASLTDDLIAHYTFDEGSGTTAGDSAGSNNGIFTNYPTWDTANYKIGSGAISFDGVDDNINTGRTGDLGQKVTISTWIKFNRLVGNGRDLIVGSRYYGDGEFVLEQHSVSGMLVFTSANGHIVQWTPPGLTTGQWHHVVLVIDTTQSTNPEKVKLYFNNVLVNQAHFAGVTNDSIVATSPIRIGGVNLPGSSSFSGSLDDVRIYNRPLSSVEVQDLYNYTGSSIVLPPDTVISTDQPSYTLTIQKSGTGNGNIVGGSINCGSTCTQSNIVSGTSVTLTATPVSGSTFTGWSGGNCSSTNVCSNTISSNTTLTATFDNANAPASNNTEWYVSPTGTPSNTGTINSPWDLQFALNGANGVIKSGHTIWLRGGRYVGTDQLNYSNILTKKFFASKLKGTKQDPIIVRGYSTERATIDGGIESSGEWTTFWGFEITNSDSVNRTGCPKDRSGGLNLLARGNKAINMIIHDGGHPGIGFWNPVGDGGELYGNIMWANGIYDTCDGGTAQNPNTRGSGFYMQNNTGTRYVHDNISFWNFTTGMKAYGNNTDGFDFEGNIVFNNPYENLFVTANGNTTKRLKIISNYTFQERDKASGNVGLGIYSPGVYDPGVDVIIQNNYLATGDIIPWPQNGNYPAPALKIDDFSDMTVINNTFVGGQMASLLLTNRLTNINWNNNTYHSTRTASPNFPFSFQDARITPIKRSSHFFSDWKTACNCDSNSTYTTGLPSTNAVFVRPNKYEQGRAHIVVYNWQNLSGVNVNVSNVLGVGDRYEVKDVQNYFGTPVAQGTYSGGEISLPMNLTAVSVPIGNIVTSSAHTSSQFGAFVLTRTSSSGNSPVQQPTTDPITSPTNASCSTRLNRCTTGTVSNRTSNTTHNLWTCNGLNGGTNASCSTLKTVEDPVNPIVPVDPLPSQAPLTPTYTPAYTPVHTPTPYTYKKPTTSTPKPIAGTPDLPPSPSFEPLDFIPTDYIQILLNLIKQFFIDLIERIQRGVDRIIG